MNENPFETLRVGPDASEEQIVQQGARLCQVASDEASRNRIRQAVQRLTHGSATRLLAALLTHPHPEHTSAELERWIATHRRPPRATGEIEVPAVAPGELKQLLLEILATEVAIEPEPLEWISGEENPGTLARETSEALWQGLLGDMQA